MEAWERVEFSRFLAFPLYGLTTMGSECEGEEERMKERGGGGDREKRERRREGEEETGIRENEGERGRRRQG